MPGNEIYGGLDKIFRKKRVNFKPGFYGRLGPALLFHQEPGNLLAQTFVVGVNYFPAGYVVCAGAIDQVMSGNICHAASLIEEGPAMTCVLGEQENKLQQDPGCWARD